MNTDRELKGIVEKHPGHTTNELAAMSGISESWASFVLLRMRKRGSVYGYGRNPRRYFKGHNMKADIETLSDHQQGLVRFMNHNRCYIFMQHGIEAYTDFSWNYRGAWLLTHSRGPSNATLHALRRKGVLVEAPGEHVHWNSTRYTLADDWKDKE